MLILISYHIFFYNMQNQIQNTHMLRVFIIGTTAVGKTKLSVELAKHLKGEIISCDSKQLYKHASIMTAKVTPEEAQGVPHFMVDCLNLHQNTFNRNKYFREASKAIGSIESRKKEPIIVGGTNYYIQTLLYNLKALNEKNNSDNQQSQSEVVEEKQKLAKEKILSEKQIKEIQWMKSLPKQDKYQMLLKYDKLIAMKTHRNDQNRITQFLERIIINGEEVSKNYQNFTADLRYQNSIVFWVRNSDKQQLLDMVTKRIYKMLDKNGLSEIFSIFYYIQVLNSLKNKETQIQTIEEYSGAGSSIGVREFKELYLQVRKQIQEIFKQNKQKLQSKGEPDYSYIHDLILSKFQKIIYSEETLAKCREQLILDTKHYCKRQITWIKNRIFVNNEENRKHFFVLELSQQLNEQPFGVMERFDRQVAKRAIEIIESIKKNGFGSVIEEQKMFSVTDKIESIADWKKYYCQSCKVQINGLYDWNCHVASKNHTKQVKYFQKREERLKDIQQQKQLAKQRRLAKEKQQTKKGEKIA